MEAETKTCRVCERHLPVEQFYRAAKARDGRDARCKDCCRAYMRAYYEAHGHKWQGYRATARAKRVAA